MYYQVTSGMLFGVEGKLICVEVDVSHGLPYFSMVGFLSSELKEAKERVISALRSVSFTLPPKRITVNLSPAHTRKAGSSFDFPIAVAILGSFNVFPKQQLNNAFLAGEMSLDGKLYAVKGLLPMILAAKKSGFEQCFVPKANEKELVGVNGIDIYLISSLEEMLSYLKGQKEVEKIIPKRSPLRKRPIYPDFSEVKGQYQVKRALEIAVTGRHNVLLIGPAGCGKSLLTKCLRGVLPPLEKEDVEEVRAIYSARGLPYEESGYPPIRSPHHTVSSSSLLGGGTYAKAGEITLAHHGVLFLDELAEFKKHCLEGLREPMEDQQINLSRSHYQYIFPADMMVIATMNPCPCGQYPDRKACTCSYQERLRYKKKISRPIKERFDMILWMEKVEQKELSGMGEGSDAMYSRILQGLKKQKERYKKESFHYNSRIPTNEIENICLLDEETKNFSYQLFEQKELSMREFHHMLKVARTIADLDEDPKVSIQHLAEAVSFYQREEMEC